MFEIRIKRDFSAAHQLRGYDGNCANLHGHNWTVVVTVRTEKLDSLGIAIDFRKLKTEVDKVIEEFDHTNLNTLKYFTSSSPTSENLSKFIFEKLSLAINNKNAKVNKVLICESPDTGAAYFVSE